MYIKIGSNKFVYIKYFCNFKKDSDIEKNNSILYSKQITNVKIYDKKK